MRAAFTLIELVIVLAILAILASIAGVRYGGAVTRHRVEAAAERIAADVELLQNRARQTSRELTLTFRPGADSYGSSQIAALDNPDADYEVDLSRDPYQVDLVTATLGGDNAVVFDLYGKPDSGGTIQLRAGDWTATVTIDADTGRAIWN
jgi:type II secretion system protein H